jgi:ribosomal protein S18 acetylase RimI-like enzyme
MPTTVSPVLVREADRPDLPTVAAYAAALARLHAGFDPRRFTYPPPPNTDVFAAFFEAQRGDPACVLLLAEAARRGGQPAAGYAFARVEPASIEALAPASGWIHDLYVAPEGRRGGVGGALLDASIAALRTRGAEAILLAVAPSNGPAQQVFRCRGLRSTMHEMMLDPA